MERLTLQHTKNPIITIKIKAASQTNKKNQNKFKCYLQDCIKSNQHHQETKKTRAGWDTPPRNCVTSSPWSTCRKLPPYWAYSALRYWSGRYCRISRPRQRIIMAVRAPYPVSCCRSVSPIYSFPCTYHSKKNCGWLAGWLAGWLVSVVLLLPRGRWHVAVRTHSSLSFLFLFSLFIPFFVSFFFLFLVFPSQIVHGF